MQLNILTYIFWYTYKVSQSYILGIYLESHTVCLKWSEVTQSCPTLCDPMGCSLPGSSSPWDFPGNSTGVDCHFLLQGIFPTQGLNPGLLHCRQTLYHLSHQGSPWIYNYISNISLSKLLKSIILPSLIHSLMCFFIQIHVSDLFHFPSLKNF